MCCSNCDAVNIKKKTQWDLRTRKQFVGCIAFTEVNRPLGLIHTETMANAKVTCVFDGVQLKLPSTDMKTILLSRPLSLCVNERKHFRFHIRFQLTMQR